MNAPHARRHVGDVADAASLFAALGDRVRLQIVDRLGREGPLSIVRLTEGTNISRQAITKHLNALRSAQLVEGTRSGRERVWQLRAERLADVQRYLKQISAQWDEAIGRLAALVETAEH